MNNSYLNGNAVNNRRFGLMSSVMQIVPEIYVLVRPLNCLLTAVSVGVGALLAAGSAWQANVTIAVIGAACLTAAGNALNDVVDLPEDLINRPDRPLPAGLISTRVASWAAACLLTVGLSLAWRAGTIPGIIATVVAVALITYAFWLKRLGPAGNVVIAMLAAATFPYGALAAGNLGRAWIPAIFAALYHLGREFVKGIEDMDGDSRHSIQTAALRWGPVVAGRIAGLCLATVATIALLPWTMGIYGASYGIPVLALDLLLIWWIRQLWNGRPPARLSRRLLIGMALGLLAICLGEATSPPHAPQPPIQEIR